MGMKESSSNDMRNVNSVEKNYYEKEWKMYKNLMKNN
jgi:hypothetical protein